MYHKIEIKKAEIFGIIYLEGLTMKLLNEEQIEIKKSKFIALMYEVDSVLEVQEILTYLKKEHKKARHLPYAYKIDMQIKKSDDKEPSQTAGSPILNIIEKRDLNHVLIVIIRYFGGIKLGAGGLIRAYSQAANLVSTIKTKD